MEDKKSPEDLVSLLDMDCIPYRLYHHDAVFTVAQSQSIDRDIPGAHCRNMFLYDKKGNMILVTLRHETPLDLKKLSAELKIGRVSFGSPERLWQYLGVRPGSVTPFSVLNDHNKEVTLILEGEMMTETYINVHPLINTMTISLNPFDLLKFLEKRGIKYQILSLKELSPDIEPTPEPI